MEDFLKQAFSSSPADSFDTTGSIYLKSPARRRVAPPSTSLLDLRSFIVTSSASIEPLCDMVASSHIIDLLLFKRASSSKLCDIAYGNLLIEAIQRHLEDRVCRTLTFWKRGNYTSRSNNNSNVTILSNRSKNKIKQKSLTDTPGCN